MINKEAKRIERYFKGVANHYRISVLWLVADYPKITLGEIAEKLDVNVKTIAEHTRRLTLAGLVNKKYAGSYVTHTLSPYGKKFLRYTKTFLLS